MEKTAVIFPGQGSQYLGMGKDFYQTYLQAQQIFKKADQILGYSLSRVIFEGSEEELRKTVNTQPAILTTSLAIWSVFQELNITPDYMAGHSLGEYSALTAAGSMSIENALELVKKRSQFMEDAVPNGEGTMAAVMGMESELLESFCKKVTEEGDSVELANLNTPSQLVVSGTRGGVEKLMKVAKENGARRVIPLPVSGPFHSRLMQPAKEDLKPYVNSANILEPSIPVVMNVNARPETSPLRIRTNLIDQVISPVQWTASVEQMIDEGVSTFIEIGPGNVLSGLVKKINKSVKTYSIQDIVSFEKFKEDYLYKKVNE